jgi:5-oxoprolinase (ATP-hydrolysing)
MTGVPHPRDQPVDTSKIQSIRMGTTVATNALLERNGERTVLVTTQGFHDLLYIGNQSRPKIFDLEIHMPDVSSSALTKGGRGADGVLWCLSVCVLDAVRLGD